MDALADTRDKLARGASFIDTLEQVMASYHASAPFFIQSRTRGDEVESLFRVRIPIPREVPLLVGDAVHNIRASLDYLVCALAEHAGIAITAQHAYPFHRDRTRIDAEIARRLKGLRSDVHVFVSSTRPFYGGNPPLWTLHVLDNADKHRRLLVAAAAPGRTILSLQKTTPSGMQQAVIPVPLSDGRFPLADGDVLWSEPTAPIVEIGEDGTPFAGLRLALGQPRFEIAVSMAHPETGNPLPMVRLLREMHAAVDRIITRAGEELF